MELLKDWLAGHQKDVGTVNHYKRRLTRRGRGTPTLINAGITGSAVMAVTRERNAVATIMVAGLVAGVGET